MHFTESVVARLLQDNLKLHYPHIPYYHVHVAHTLSESTFIGNYEYDYKFVELEPEIRCTEVCVHGSSIL